MTNPIKFTIFASPQPLTKTITAVDGKLVKSTPSSFVTQARRMTRSTLAEVMADLDQCAAPDACGKVAAGWGVHVSEADVVHVDTDALVASGQAVAGAIARTQQHMHWGNAAGVVMFDFDQPHEPEAARAALVAAWRTTFGNDDLATVEMFYRPSSSAGCYIEGVEPLAGGRAYVACKRAEDVPRIGAGIFAGLWLNGHGIVEASAAGTPLVRSLIDATVWQPERIDYVCPAILGEGVQRSPVATVRWGDPGKMLPALTADIPPTVTTEFERLKEQAIEVNRDMLAERRKAWVEERVAQQRDAFAAHGVTGPDLEKKVEAARATFTDAGDAGALVPSFQLCLSADMREWVTVGEILRDPGKYHGRKCCDPLEPHGTFGKAKIYTNSAPIVHSFLHGGQRFRMVTRSRLEVPLMPDNLRAAFLRNTVDALKRAFPGVLYRQNGGVTYVTAAGELRPMSATMLALFASDGMDFTSTKKERGGKTTVVRSAMPRTVADNLSVASRDDAFVDFPPIVQVTKAPFIVPSTGEIVSDFGYHAGTQTYLHSDGNFPPLTVIHSKDQAIRIARRLIEPYVDFNFFNEKGEPNHHEAQVLTMILMAALRATVVCPVLLVTASRAGEGKTYLVRCLVAEKGERANFIAWSPDAAEAEKRLATVGIRRPAYIAIDNFDSAIGGDSLEALTDKAVDECVEIRVLGSSTMVPVYNNAFIGITGINLRPANEAMARRSMSIVLEPAAGGAAWASRALKLPYAPAEYILANWRERHMLALSLVKWQRDQRAESALPAFNALPDYDALNRRLVWSLFGVDVVAAVFADAMEMAAQNDATSPKGRLCYYAWEMCRAWERTGEEEKHGDVIGTGKLLLLPATEDELRACVPEWMGGKPPFKFTIAALKEFIQHNNLDNSGVLDVVLKSMKLLGGAGFFNGMKFVSTGEKHTRNFVALWRLEGMPHPLPAERKAPVFFGKP